jgi:hypothetical protein
MSIHFIVRDILYPKELKDIPNNFNGLYMISTTEYDNKQIPKYIVKIGKSVNIKNRLTKYKNVKIHGIREVIGCAQTAEKVLKDYLSTQYAQYIRNIKASGEWFLGTHWEILSSFRLFDHASDLKIDMDIDMVGSTTVSHLFVNNLFSEESYMVIELPKIKNFYLENCEQKIDIIDQVKIEDCEISIIHGNGYDRKLFKNSLNEKNIITYLNILQHDVEQKQTFSEKH